MFTTKRKKNYMTFIYSAIIVVLCLLITAIAWPEETTAPANAQKKTETADTTTPLPVEPPQLDNENRAADEKGNISENNSTYYLVKRADGQIKVFFINESGEPLELETTEIIYELLSDADQKLFDEGCRVESQEELAVLLQDFES